MKKFKKSLSWHIAISLFFIVPPFVQADVPFEVVKTYVTAEETDPIGGASAVVVDEILYSDAAEGEKFHYPPKKGEFDLRIKVPIEAITYKFEFWNVGEMGGEKGFIFKSNYGKAKLTRTYEIGQAYKNVLGDQEFMGLHSLEKKEVRTPSVKTKFVDDLIFTGGPYGKFYYVDKKGGRWPLAHLSDGKTITFENTPEGIRKENSHYLMSFGRVLDIHPVVTNRSAFEKWMEILQQGPGCQDPSDPETDSGWRFSDYYGEVSVRPCNSDDDSWYGAELDMVLHNGDHIKNGDDSTCTLTSRDWTFFSMNQPNSEIILSYSKQKTNIQVLWGKIKVNVKRMIKDGSMDVEMSEAVAGIKGTTFIAEETGTQSTLKVIEGEVEFTSKRTGKKEMVKSGEMIIATKEGLGEKKTFNVTQENKIWDTLQEKLQKNTDEKTASKITKSTEEKESPQLIYYSLWIIILLVVIGMGYFLKKRNIFQKKK